MRITFDEQLENLHAQLLEMGALLEKGIENSTNALLKQDKNEAYNAIEIEKEVDKKERDIESLCLKLLLQQQPVAKDLRAISAALKMITDMERIGDQIADISEIILHLIGTPFIKKLEHLPLMAEATTKMLNYSIDAFVRNDEQTAKEVIAMDDIVDNLFITIRTEIVQLIGKNSDVGEQALDFLMIAKYYERIGDHTVNIAEWVLFSLTGKHKNFN